MAVIELTDGRPDGTRFGQSATDKISFYGGTPAVQPTVTAIAATTATFSAAFTGMWAYASSTAAKAESTAVRQMYAALAAVNLI